MSEAVFVDTNVLVYTRDGSEPIKNGSAIEWMEFLWKTRSGRLSMQVLHEYYITTTVKLKPGLSREAARADIGSLLAWKPLPMNEPVLLSAWKLQDKYSLSWWDSLIVSAAQLQGCKYLLSEDLQHGQVFQTTTVISPFKTRPK